MPVNVTCMLWKYAYPLIYSCYISPKKKSSCYTKIYLGMGNCISHFPQKKVIKSLIYCFTLHVVILLLIPLFTHSQIIFTFWILIYCWISHLIFIFLFILCVVVHFSIKRRKREIGKYLHLVLSEDFGGKMQLVIGMKLCGNIGLILKGMLEKWSVIIVPKV